jgi:hypothetical protein
MTRSFCRNRAAALAAVCLLPALFAPAQRIRPPDSVACSRDLTSFSGRILSMQRGDGQTEILTRSDEGTRQRFLLLHPGGDDPRKHFLLWSEPFPEQDWRRIESTPGRLRPNLHATVWVCDDSSSPIVDWQPPREEPAPAPRSG